MGGALAERLRESRDSVREVVRNPGLRRVNAALAGSVIGDWAYSVGVSVFAYRAGGPTAVGVLGVVRYVSMATVTPFSSALADRMDRKRVMVVSDLVRAVVIGAAALLVAIDAPALTVYALTVVAGVCGTAFRPAQAALLPSLANHPGELTAANVAASTIESVGFFLGPTVAGLLLAFADIPVVFAFDALTFLWSASLVARVRPAAPVEAEAEAGVAPVVEVAVEEPKVGRLSEATAGFREIAANRDLRLLVGLYCMQTVVAGASLVFSVAIALDLLDLSESGVGLLDGTLGVGGIIGGFAVLVLASRGRLAVDFGIGVLLWSLPLLLIAAVPEIAAVLVVMALVGFGNSLVDINAYTILQRLVPDQVMGRVFGALDTALIAGMAVGSLAMPLLIEVVGIRTGLVVIGSITAVLALAALPGLRRIDTIALAPEGLDLLASVSILAPLPERVLERLARGSHAVTVAAGEPVFGQGDHGDRFYVVAAGEGVVTVDGTQVATVGPGGWFGEIALLRDVPRTATVTATTDLELRAIDRRHFLAAVTGHAETWVRAERNAERTLVLDLRLVDDGAIESPSEPGAALR
jgi:MFS family permease